MKHIVQIRMMQITQMEHLKLWLPWKCVTMYIFLIVNNKCKIKHNSNIITFWNYSLDWLSNCLHLEMLFWKCFEVIRLMRYFLEICCNWRHKVFSLDTYMWENAVNPLQDWQFDYHNDWNKCSFERTIFSYKLKLLFLVNFFDTICNLNKIT